MKEEVVRRGNQDRREKDENRKTVGISGWMMIAWKKIGKERWNGRVRREEQNGAENGKGCSLLCTAYKRSREERGYLRKDMEQRSGGKEKKEKLGRLKKKGNLGERKNGGR